MLQEALCQPFKEQRWTTKEMKFKVLVPTFEQLCSLVLPTVLGYENEEGKDIRK